MTNPPEQIQQLLKDVAARDQRIDALRRERNEHLLPRISELEAQVGALATEVAALTADQLKLLTAMQTVTETYAEVKASIESRAIR